MTPTQRTACLLVFAWGLLTACSPSNISTQHSSSQPIPIRLDGDNRISLFCDRDENSKSTSSVRAEPTDPKTAGAVRITYETMAGGYGGFAVPLADQDLSGFDRIVFWARHHQGGRPQAFLQITSVDGVRKRIDLGQAFDGLNLTWKQIRVPLTEFRKAPKEILSRAGEIAVVFSSGSGVMDFDRLALQGQAQQTLPYPGAGDRALPKDHGVAGGRLFTWSGYQWRVRPATDKTVAYPGPNRWSDSQQSVWVDQAGRLHLALKFYDGNWYCSEVFTEQPLGYGRYVFHVDSPLDTIDRNVVVGLFTYLDDNNEIDIEYTKWGSDRPSVYEQYTVQPYTNPGNTSQADYARRLPNTTCSFIWLRDRIVFNSFAGNDIHHTPPDRTWVYTGGDIPAAADEKLHLNIWLFKGQWPGELAEQELVLSRFEFIPVAEVLRKMRQ